MNEHFKKAISLARAIRDKTGKFVAVEAHYMAYKCGDERLQYRYHIEDGDSHSYLTIEEVAARLGEEMGVG